MRGMSLGGARCTSPCETARTWASFLPDNMDIIVAIRRYNQTWVVVYFPANNFLKKKRRLEKLLKNFQGGGIDI